MRQLVGDGVAAGAVGFSTSRTLAHRTATGALVPTYQAAHAELIGIGAGLKAHPGAVFQMISDWDDPAAEFAALEQIVSDNGARGTFTLVQNDFRPGLWADVLARVEASSAHIRPQVIARPIGVLMGLSASMHTFSFRPSYQAIAHLAPADKAKALKNPELRAKILAETDENPHVFIKALGSRVERFFRLTCAPDYLPAPEASLGAEASRLGRDPFELVYDALLEDEGAALIYLPLTNYTDPTGGVIETMLRHEKTLPALGDGGAHVGTICDASVSTYFLNEWVTRRGAFALEEAVRRLSAAPADFFGFGDRGRIAPGLRADLNVIDLDALAIERPSLRYDLPAGGKRFLQGARGYRATVCAGAITRRDDAGTDALPGRLVRRGA
jgi:N-acyl-D-aspartate/D-glutamate deacylase